MLERRQPQQTPGPAHTTGQDNDDFTLPATMYYDAVYFVEKARKSKTKGMLRAEERFLRAALYAAFGFFEATLNQVAFAHASAHSSALNEIERDVLEEKETTIDDRGYVSRKTKFYSVEARLSFLTLFLSGQVFDRGSALWQRFIEAKKLRDTWTHPKPPFDTWSLTVRDVEAAIKTLREVLVNLSTLMGLEEPLWLVPHETAVAAIASGEIEDA